MKIKTITCHEVYNYGASLQEYALINYLESLGYEAEAIQYKPDYLSKHFNFLEVSSPKFEKNILFKMVYLILKLPKRLMILPRKWSFDKFSKKYIKRTLKRYSSNEELKMDLPEADVFICGSDQIWNSFFQNGKDPAFYLDFVPNSKLKISYAASFAIDKLEKAIEEFVKTKVSALDKVSVRETSGVNILERLGINNAVQVLDPVFLIEKDAWVKKFINQSEDKDYIFVYDFDSNKDIEKIAKRLAKDNGLKIFSVNNNIKYSDKNFYLQGPEAFLNLIYNAKYVLTNSFHAVAFSLIFEKNFLVFNRTEKINTRMRDLLGLVGFSNLLQGDKEFDYFNIKNVSYEYANEKIKEKINFSKNFLIDALTQN